MSNLARQWLHGIRGSLAARRHGARTRRGIRVYFYHGVVEGSGDPIVEGFFHQVADFRQQVAFLRRDRILSLDEFAAALSHPQDHETRGSVITFDDGYQNNLLAAEILAELRVPWCLFVTTGGIGSPGTLWPGEVSLLLLHGEAERVDLLGSSWLLRTPQHRHQAYRVLLKALKRLPASDRRAAVCELRSQFPGAETERLLERYPSMRMLAWNSVAELAAADVEIGSHGIDHVIHHDDEEPIVRQHELTASREDVEKRTARPCRFFAYPNGNVGARASLAREAGAAGYAMAFTTAQDTVTSQSNPHLLPRLIPELSMYPFIRRHQYDFRGTRG